MKLARYSVCVCGILLLLHAGLGAELFRVATYNIENYLLTRVGNRPAKSAEAREAVVSCICAINADVLALQEVGDADALNELRESLKANGLDYPYWEIVAGADTNVHLAVLSKFPFSARRPHTNDTYVVGGKRLPVKRGFGEVDVKVNDEYSFTLITAHLKSRLATSDANETEMRLEEAKLLRMKIEERLTANAETNLIVLGDFNATQDSAVVRLLIGQGKYKLIDTRPVESAAPGTNTITGSTALRTVTWTYFYGRQDTYQRVDYILLSPGMAHEWVPNQSYVLATPIWGKASDHRPVVATFVAKD